MENIEKNEMTQYKHAGANKPCGLLTIKHNKYDYTTYADVYEKWYNIICEKDGKEVFRILGRICKEDTLQTDILVKNQTKRLGRNDEYGGELDGYIDAVKYAYNNIPRFIYGATYGEIAVKNVLGLEAVDILHIAEFDDIDFKLPDLMRHIGFQQHCGIKRFAVCERGERNENYR